MSKAAAFVLAAILVALFGGSAVMERFWPETPPPRAVVGLVVDTSTSVHKDCPGMVGLMRDAINSLPRGRDSRAFLISLGSSATRFEPQLEVDLALARRASGPVRGAGDGAVFDALMSKCEGLAPADGSAIFRAVRIGLAHVQSRCAGAASCEARLYIASDGEENVALNARGLLDGRGKDASLAKLANDLPGLQTTFCGYVSTSESGAARTNEALLDRWRSFFTHPEAVQFQPYCSGRADKGAGE